MSSPIGYGRCSYGILSLEDEPFAAGVLDACGGRMVSEEELRALPLPTAMRAAAQAAQALLQRPASPACNG